MKAVQQGEQKEELLLQSNTALPEQLNNRPQERQHVQLLHHHAASAVDVHIY
jgi:hypothetical protein